MKTFALVALVVASPFFAGSVHAASWEAVSLSDKESVFLDAQSVYRDGSELKASALHTFGNVNFLGDDVYPHRSRLVVYKFECSTGQLGYAQWSFHSSDLATGKTVWNGAVADVSLFRPDAGSGEGRLVNRVCAGSGSTAQVESGNPAQ